MSIKKIECTNGELYGKLTSLQQLINAVMHQEATKSAARNFNTVLTAYKSFVKDLEAIGAKHFETDDDGQKVVDDESGDAVWLKGKSEDTLTDEVDSFTEADADIKMSIVDAQKYIWGYPGMTATGAMLIDCGFMFENLFDAELPRKKRRGRPKGSKNKGK